MIEKYLKSFPYLNSFMGEDDITLFFLKSSEGKSILRMLDLERSDELEDAIIGCDLDFSKCSFWPYKFFPERNELLYFGDDDNKERINAYIIDLNSRSSRKITDSNYVALCGFSPDRKTMVYSDRYEYTDGVYRHKLKMREFPDGEDTILWDDSESDYKITWGRVAFSKDQKKIYFLVDYKSKRSNMNFMEFDLETKEGRLLLPKERECSFPYFKGSSFKDTFVYVSDIDGFENIYRLDLKSGESKQLTQMKEENNGIGLSYDEKTLSIVEYDIRKDQSTVSLYNIADGNFEKLNSKVFKNKLGLHSQYNSLWLVESNLSNPYEIVEFNDELEEIRRIQYYLGEKPALVNNTYEFCEYETFDGKKVPGFITIPKGEIKGAVITSFYGGSNRYAVKNQLFSELGLIHLSPGVRGSDQFGKEWRDLIKGDLGGKEIIDLAWGAKYLEERFDLKPSQIGVTGGSHGGYAVLRALTMPEGFAGIKGSKYPWGFGLCWCGFASLEHFYDTSNIPDWLVFMLGEIETHRDKYRDRSPNSHLKELNSPVYISHGSNDSRVNIGSITDFIELAKENGKDHLLSTNIVEGAGHSYVDYQDNYNDYEQLINFINSTLK
ncbi:MAG: prolyl oligopeptidase family serine peptidase [Oligoflexia bacterium]|nr:prolyl oligopeptidase family serine peptidase [Oligoflexia bacterium]